MTKYDERESNDSVGDERLRRVKPRIRLRPPLSFRSLSPSTVDLVFISIVVSLFCFLFSRFSFSKRILSKRSNTFFCFSDRTMGLARIALVAHCENRKERERERQREKHGGGDIYGIVDKSCCAALYLLFD